jgi:8-oxo-dGTP pyrophosphatase MutT (NUDIX family)
MFIPQSEIDSLVKDFGRPHEVEFSFNTPQIEFDGIRASQKHGRQHDFTLYIVKDARLIVIAKHFYPPGLYRAPSGGVHPGESVRDGINREAYEETGCTISLSRFLLKSNVSFVCGDDRIDWVSYVLQAAYTSGEFVFTDHEEIREVHLATVEEFDEYSKIMRASPVAGLHYRADLHETVAKLLSV